MLLTISQHFAVYYWVLNRRQAIIWHYTDVIMGTIASQITHLTIVYSSVYSGADQRKHQSSASQAFVWGIHRDRWIPYTKGQLRGKCFHLMTSSWSEPLMNQCTDLKGWNKSEQTTTLPHTLLLTWINLNPNIVWDENIYQFPNFNGCTVEVWEWIRSFIHGTI